MLYAQDDFKNAVLLKFMVEKLINEYDTKENIILKHKIVMILQAVARLHRTQESIYNIDSTYLQEILYLSKYASDEVFQNIQDNIEKERLTKLLLLLNDIK